MHDLADDLVALHGTGRAHDAIARLPELWALLERMRGQFGGFVIRADDGDRLQVSDDDTGSAQAHARARATH